YFRSEKLSFVLTRLHPSESARPGRVGAAVGWTSLSIQVAARAIPHGGPQGGQPTAAGPTRTGRSTALRTSPVERDKLSEVRTRLSESPARRPCYGFDRWST